MMPIHVNFVQDRKPVHNLVGMFYATCAQLASSIQLDLYDPSVMEQVSDILVWSSIHVNSSVEIPMPDEKSTFSGLYVARSSHGSGSLKLLDPRGPYSPYRNHHAQSLTEGKLFVFPSFIPHAVTQSQFIGSNNLVLWNLKLRFWPGSAVARSLASTNGQAATRPVDRQGYEKAISGDDAEPVSIDDVMDWSEDDESILDEMD